MLTGTLTSPKLSEPVHSGRGISAAGLAGAARFRRAGARLRGRLASAGLALAQAGLERGQQIRCLLGFGRGRDLDLLALGLALDQGQELLTVVVAVAPRLEA